jgi:hypothetical protein
MTPSMNETAVAPALGKAAAGVTRVAHGLWELTLCNGVPFAVQARVDDGWLTVDASLGPAPGGNQAWQLLQHNAALGGAVRLALGAAGGIVARADLPLDADLDVSDRIQAICRSIETAKARVDGAPRSSKPAPDALGPSIPRPDALPGICAEAGWPLRRHEDGRFGVGLDVPGAFHEAALGSRGEDTVAWSSLFDDVIDGTHPPAPASRRALAVLLLRSCGLVRLVRACAAPDDGEQRLWLEVPFAGTPTPAELSHALGALSVACRLVGREANVLRHDPTVAALYVRQWSDNQEEE